MIKKQLLTTNFTDLFKKALEIASNNVFHLKILLKVLISLIKTPDFDITEISQIFIDNFFTFSQANSYIHRNFIAQSLKFLLKYLQFYEFSSKSRYFVSKNLNKCSTMSFLIKMLSNNCDEIRLLSWNIVYLLCNLKEISLFSSLLDNSLEIFINLKL